ncbi:glycosyl transferase family A [Bacillus sp. FJAT-25509]|uniref:CDP-glycerol glycerophosphotransferase family protein n=1 Tax=Bacillus sp. FJAT-25509 TaxID=1712029 RepID=UPI0006F9D50B|nr:CDP-glycerol glycerophosphotransferase family protein [Bacillus sp. FJAT-25509]KQL42421.1 glycosyl transferase family A [Bacillus sp. FJAT-25509]
MNSIDKSHDYLFSIIMPIYNVEKFLVEAIDSVINQTIGFEENIQLILVNDESPDDSEKICVDYQNRYPKNIQYLKKPNGGVSSARNYGIDYIKGKYVQFLDPDDTISIDTLLNVYTFFEEHEEEIDLVAIPIKFFEARTGNHTLNNKFGRTRVIDIIEQPNLLLTHAASAFIKSDLMKKYQFDRNCRIGEDCKLVSHVILEKNKYGVLKNASYNYRLRNDGTSAMQNAMKNDWFIHSLDTFSLDLIHKSIEQVGELPEYIQYIIMHDLKWKFSIKSQADTPLSDEDYIEFKNKIKEILTYIDDEVILKTKKISQFYLHFALSLKHNIPLKEVFTKSIEELEQGQDIGLYRDEYLVTKLSKNKVTIEFIEEKNSNLMIEGFFGSLFDREECKIIAKINGVDYVGEDVDRTVNQYKSLDEIIKQYKGFKISIPFSKLPNEYKIEFFVEVDGVQVQVNYNVNKFTGLSKRIRGSYSAKERYIYSCRTHHIKGTKKSGAKKLINELKIMRGLWKLGSVHAKKAIVTRLVAKTLRKLESKPVWLFMDRQDKADDNAERLFKFANSQQKSIKNYYVIKKDAPDFERISKVGNVVPYGSYKHKFLMLRASKVISSHADQWVTNPFFKAEIYYRDLMTFDYIFLQHGITMANLTHWLNRFNKNIRKMFTSAHLEAQSLIEGDYSYTSENIRLTGFPRYDGLVNNDQKQILIMPTWRQNLVLRKNQALGVRPYNEAFKKSEYFKRYNDLINDPRLIDFAKKNNYKIIFFPHPEIQIQNRDFDKNDYVQFAEYNTSYQKLFNESSILLTDYSSVAFDFAYQKKPVIYYQYDYYHFEKGYFNFETMGFGDIIDNHDVLVDKFISYMANQCEMEDKYKERVDSFYAYTDRHNSQRVFDEILEIENGLK